MKLSLIIPVYNVEKYVEKCLRSCINQDLPKDEYEIIVVNDGSPDGSLEIVQRIAAEEPNIKVISQENQGLSMARNNGLAQAQGDYVWFIDSDDWIEENCLRGIVEALEKDDLDILHIRYKNTYEDGAEPNVPEQKYLEGIFTGKEITELGGLGAPAPFSVLRSKLLKKYDLRFVPRIYHEDTEFKPRVTYYAERIKYYDKEVYDYLQRQNGSITSNYKIKNGLDSITVCHSLYTFSKDLEPGVQAAFAMRISQILYTHFERFNHLNETDSAKLLAEYKKQKALFRYMTKSKLPKDKIAGIVLLLNTRFGIWLFNRFEHK